MSPIRGDASDIYRLAADLSSVAARSVPALGAGMADAGRTVERAWRNNAIVTSGVHGKHYPNSITSEVRATATGLGVEVGPDTSRPQGSMGRGFEFGSMNQPPHLDGARAVADNEARIEQIIDQAMGRVIP